MVQLSAHQRHALTIEASTSGNGGLAPRPRRKPQGGQGSARPPPKQSSSGSRPLPPSVPSCPPTTKPAPRQVSFPGPFPRNPTVAIIGGGLSGLICALELANNGIKSTVFDTGEHGVGGRLATRTASDGSLRNPEALSTDPELLVFDHAAQYFSASDPRFVQMVERWEGSGAVKQWDGPTVGTLQSPEGRFTAFKDRDTPRYIGVGGMRELAEYLAATAEASTFVNVQRPVWVNMARADTSRSGGWKLRCSGKKGGIDLGIFDAVVIAHNGKCANRLSAPMGVPAVHAALRRLKLSANWVLMVAFEKPVLVPEQMQGAFIQGSEVLSWAGNNTAKLGLVNSNSSIECWTLISTQKYGKSNKVPQEAIPPEVGAQVTEEMVESFATALGMLRSDLPQVVYAKPQLWGAALPLNTPGSECLWDAKGRVGVAGDWVAGGGSMEAAAVSGIAMAECIATEARGQGKGNIGLTAEFKRVKGEEIGVFPSKADTAKALAVAV